MLALRPVREDDCRQLWEWANDPQVREASFSSARIPWEEHVAWFRSKLRDANCLFYIAMDGDGAPLGQIRYDLDGQDAVISVSVAHEFRGRGHGSELITLGSQRLFNDSDVTVIHAYIKPDNEASVRAFAKAGFADTGMDVIHDQRALHFTFRRSTS